MKNVLYRFWIVHVEKKKFYVQSYVSFEQIQQEFCRDAVVRIITITFACANEWARIFLDFPRNLIFNAWKWKMVQQTNANKQMKKKKKQIKKPPTNNKTTGMIFEENKSCRLTTSLWCWMRTDQSIKSWKKKKILTYAGDTHRHFQLLIGWKNYSIQIAMADSRWPKMVGFLQKARKCVLNLAKQLSFDHRIGTVWCNLVCSVDECNEIYVWSVRASSSESHRQFNIYVMCVVNVESAHNKA